MGHNDVPSEEWGLREKQRLFLRESKASHTCTVLKSRLALWTEFTLKFMLKSVLVGLQEAQGPHSYLQLLLWEIIQLSNLHGE